MEALVSVALGLGLAAAAGLRVFVPVFGVALAARFGLVSLNQDFAWVATAPALIAFGTATVLEVLAYYVPWVDHALDAVAAPAAVAAGVLTSASVITDLPPWLAWGIAIAGGGGLAGLTQALSIGARIKSAITTGGLANPLVATVETLGATGLVLLAVFVPLVAAAVLVGGCVLADRLIGRLTWRRRPG
jgi:hypothetical protein